MENLYNLYTLLKQNYKEVNSDTTAIRTKRKPKIGPFWNSNFLMGLVIIAFILDLRDILIPYIANLKEPGGIFSFLPPHCLVRKQSEYE